MFVTIDSNVLSLPQLIAEKLPFRATRWCTKVNRCQDVDDLDDTSVFFNTPVGMSTDVLYYNMPEEAIHFVYLDFGKNFITLKQILTNIALLRNVVILSNGDIYSTGQYVLTVGNCTNDDIADVISGIIVVHLKERRSIDQSELITLLCGKKYTTPQVVSSSSSASATAAESAANRNQKIYNLYTVLDSKRSNYGEIDNCYECKK